RGNRTMHGKQIQKPESEWIIVENTHEPLVDRDQWDAVQKQLKSRKRSIAEGSHFVV
ncbi:MAG: recombinase family protein, partial [Oscillospiraceae bacterium]|nr:recombinase family protein [Oscillospiraceae bacterium]